MSSRVIFVRYVTKESILFHPFHQTRHAFRYKHISIIGTLTIGVDMLGSICEIEIIMIINKKNFTLRSKDQYNACINYFLILTTLEITFNVEVVSLPCSLNVINIFDVIDS